MESLKSVKVWFSALSLGAILVAVLSFAIKFRHLSYSGKTSDWELFASYFSNISTPLISALAVLAFVFTHKQQQEIIEQQNLTIKNNQSTANEERTLMVIDRLEADLEKLGKRSFDITVKGKAEVANVYSMLFSPSDGLFAIYNELSEKVKLLDKVPTVNFTEEEKKLYSLFESVSLAVAAINQIRVHCLLLEEISSHNIYTRYFQRKYKLPWKRILDVKLKDDEWKEPIVRTS